MKKLLILLVVKALVLVLIITFGKIGLAPDEAQYWTWSQELDWGYYSKPPGIAWQIALSTLFFGNDVLGVRFGALVIGFLISLVVYDIARAASLSIRTAFWAGVVAAFCPLGIYLSFAATTDGGMILFFALAAMVIMKGLQQETQPNYLLTGLCILAAALFKWTAYVFWPIVLIYMLFFKSLRSWKFLAGVALSLIALLPSLYWNMRHDWATFRHVGATVGVAKSGNFFDFLAAQIGLLSPIFFVLLFLSYFYLKKSPKKALLFAAGFPLVAFLFIFTALFKKMQPNWAAYLYPVGLPLVAWLGCDQLKRGKLWLHLGIWLSILSVAFLFALPQMQESGRLPLSYRLSPFRQSMGGECLTSALVEAGYRPDKDFLFADKYQVASLLSFYGPHQKRAYYFNISETRKNQFSYWPQMEQKEIGKNGYFVVVENTDTSSLNWYETHYQYRLSPYFEKVDFRGVYPLFSVDGKPVKYALIFACIHYSGKSAPELEKY